MSIYNKYLFESSEVLDYEGLCEKGIKPEFAKAICVFAKLYKPEVLTKWVNIEVHHQDGFTVYYDDTEISILRKKLFKKYVEDSKADGIDTDENGKNLDELMAILNGSEPKEFDVDDITTFSLPDTDFYAQEL